MAETIKNTEEKKDGIQTEQEKLESVKRADAAVKSMHDFTSPEVLYRELINSVLKYHPSTDISMIEKAYKVASEAHKDQKRKSGEPYKMGFPFLCLQKMERECLFHILILIF